MSKPQNKRKALGRGIANLIPTHSEEEDRGNEVLDVDLNAIDINPYQPRIDFDDSEIAGLAESIKIQGLLQPIVLRKNGDRFQIISGERRFRAFKKLKRDCIQCMVRTNVSDKEMLELALVENVQREQLNEIEKALAYQKLIQEFNYTHETLASQVGSSRSVITNSLRLLKLPEEIQNMVRKNEIGSGHARAILSLDGREKQLEAARRIVEDKLTVRDVEQMTQQGRQPAPAEKESVPSKPKSTGNMPEAPDVANTLDQLQYKFGTPIRLKATGSGKGRVEIDYFSEDDLVRVFDILLT